MLKPDPRNRSRGATPGAFLGILAFALVTLVAATPISSLKFTSDANANGNSLTNAATIEAANIYANNVVATNGITGPVPSTNLTGAVTNMISSPAVTSSNFTGNGAGITNIPSSAYATTAGYATNSGFATSAATATNATTASNSTYATTAGFATSAATATNATTAGNVPLSGITGLGSGVAAATAKSTGTNGGLATLPAILAPGINLTLGTTSGSYDIVLGPGRQIVMQNFVYPPGLSGWNVICYGDSLVQGDGTGGATALSETPDGVPPSFPGQLQSMSFLQGSSVYNLGLGGIGAVAYAGNANATTNYAFNGFTSAISTVAGSKTLTIVGSTSGMTNNSAVGALTLTPGTYFTSSISASNQVTMSQPALATSTNTTGYFIGNVSGIYGVGSVPYPDYYGTAHQLSNLVTGTPTMFIDWLGAADYYVGGVAVTGTLTSGTNLVTGVTLQTTNSVSGASLSTTNAVAGYNAFTTGTLTGSTNDYLPTGTNTTVTASTSSTLTLSQPATRSGTITLALTPSASGWQTADASILAAAVSDGDWPVRMTIIPGYIDLNGAAGYGCSTIYNGQRLADNAWIKSYCATSNIPVIDVANMPELLNPCTTTSNNPYYSTLVTPHGQHLSSGGYLLVANFVNTALQSAFAPAGTTNTTYTNYFSNNGIPARMLPSTVIFSTPPLNGISGTGYTQSINTALNMSGALGITTVSSGGALNISNAYPAPAVNISTYWGGGTQIDAISALNGGLNASGGYEGFRSGINTSTYNYGFTRFGVSAVGSSNNYEYMGINGGATTFAQNSTGGTESGTLNVSGVINPNAAQSTTNGSTSGTVVSSMPFNGSAFKEASFQLIGFNGTATIILPASFTSTNTMNAGGPLSTVITINGVNSATITTSSNTTGRATIDGY